MEVPADDDLFTRTAQPRIEPEIAFRLGRVLDGPLIMATAADVIDGVAAAMEIIDSRYAGFGFRLPDVIADNTSAAAFVIGDWADPATPGDLATVRCVFTGDGHELHTATAAAVLGHPLRALIHLSQHLAKRGEHLPAGAVVLAGALTDAVIIRPGVTYRARMDRLGAVSFSASAQERTAT
jgi:2-oxo-3-hexenedioate decarboxylase